MKETEGADCYFWTPEKAGDGVSGKKCDHKAAIFVRVKHSGRLCPLCAPCKESFVRAQGHMSDESRKALPGEAAYEEVPLADGMEEYAKQPPRK